MTKVQEACPKAQRARLKLLRSDLYDATNPKVLAKYPHLGDPELIRQLEREIVRLERDMGFDQR
jgi:hypothetical protein